MTDELELKYAVEDAAALETWLDSEFPPVAGEPWRDQRVTDRYFDTADRALGQAGYGARLRRTGEAVVLGVKTDIDTKDGVHHRLELEAPGVDRLEPARWPESEVRALIEQIVGDRPLVERFVLRQQRRERRHSVDGGVCMLSIDVVKVVARDRTLAELCQLEVELLAGEGVLREMARRIESSGLVTPEPRSKMAIAARLVEGTGR